MPSSHHNNNHLDTISKDSTQEITYLEDGSPYSNRFKDIYFNRESGYQQNDDTFIKGNKIEQAFLNAQQVITIAETGFGTGLNFLLTLQAYQKAQAQLNKKLPLLHFISVEKYPLTKGQLTKALAIVPQLKQLAHLLVAQYPSQESTCQTSGFPKDFEGDFFNEQVKLSLIFDDATEGFRRLEASKHGLVDIWYLDGFSPAKNPDMWSEELFRHIGRLSKPEASLTTFNVASCITKQLQKQGFRTENITLQVNESQLTHGIFQQSANTTKGYQLRTNITKPQHVSIIGGGIASACLAYALTKQDIEVTLYCKDTTVAQGGSSNAIGALYPLLHQQKDDISLFYQQAFWRAKALYQEIAERGYNFDHDWCGLLEVSYKESLSKRQHLFAELNTWPKELIHSVNQQQATTLAGIEVNHGGLFMPNAGWAYPVDLVNSLFEAAKNTNKLHLETQTKITKISQHSDTKAWTLISDIKSTDKNSSGKVTFDANVLVICAGADAIEIEQVKSLPLTATRGQVTSMKSNDVSKNLKTVVCHKGYLTPQNNDAHCIGATFQKNNTSTKTTTEDDEYNLAMLSKCLPEVTELISWEKKDIKTSKARLRCMSQDHLPLVGVMPDIEKHLQHYPHLAKDKNWPYKQVAPSIDNLYVLLGLGARGLCSAPLAADILTAELCGTPYPLDNNMLFNLSPNRFIIRDIIKRKVIPI